jgi:hypothetical protein
MRGANIRAPQYLYGSEECDRDTGWGQLFIFCAILTAALVLGLLPPAHGLEPVPFISSSSELREGLQSFRQAEARLSLPEALQFIELEADTRLLDFAPSDVVAYRLKQVMAAHLDTPNGSSKAVFMGDGVALVIHVLEIGDDRARATVAAVEGLSGNEEISVQTITDVEVWSERTAGSFAAQVVDQLGLLSLEGLSLQANNDCVPDTCSDLVELAATLVGIFTCSRIPPLPLPSFLNPQVICGLAAAAAAGAADDICEAGNPPGCLVAGDLIGRAECPTITGCSVSVTGFHTQAARSASYILDLARLDGSIVFLSGRLTFAAEAPSVGFGVPWVSTWTGSVSSAQAACTVFVGGTASIFDGSRGAFGELLGGVKPASELC